jgi:hypothetical protein
MQLFGVFFNSAIYHSLLYYPTRHDFPFFPQAVFYLGSAIACILERSFRQVTGKRVEGTWGKIWTWAVFTLVSAPLVGYCELFGVTHEGRVIARENREASPAFLLYRALGGTMVKD